jgi:DNA invertase Pin-like site-specific DNA recombinase
VAAPLVEKLVVPKPVMTPLSATPPDNPAKSNWTDGLEPMVGAGSAHPEDPSPGPVSPPAARDEENVGGARLQVLGYVSVTDSRDSAEPDPRKQIAAMDAVCERRGWRLVEVARDARHTEGPPLNRPGLFYALERLAGNEASCLMVADLRRLSSSAAELGGLLRWLRDRDLRLVAVDVDLDTASPDGRIAADALITVGELEDARHRRGASEMSADPDMRSGPLERPGVRDLPALRKHIVAMRSAGMTLQAIADRLNDEGVPTLRGGREWRPSSVQTAAGYRRPRQVSAPRGVHARGEQRRRTEDR